LQQDETSNSNEIAEFRAKGSTGRLLALDLGTKRIGVAVSDELRITVRRLDRIERTSWKKLLIAIRELIAEFDAAAVVIGLPLGSDGSESEMSLYARDIARKLRLSVETPVILHDERVTSYDAKKNLWSQGLSIDESRKLVDSEAAAILLEDLLSYIK